MDYNAETMVIAGGGPAGLTAAIYAARAGISPLVFEGLVPGGQLAQEELIENYPGFPDGVSGPELAAAMRRQAERFGARFRPGEEISGFERAPGWRILVKTSSGESVLAKTLIGATGSRPRRLGIPGESDYIGRGVSYCAVCDAAFFKGMDVAVVGGGTSGLAAARHLSRLCKSVVVISDSPPEAEARLVKAFDGDPSVTIRLRARATGIVGDGSRVTAVRIADSSEAGEIPVSGVFVAVGQTPSVDWARGQVELDRHGRIHSWGGGTNVPGVFAAGDACEPFLRQVVTAAASGAIAATSAMRYLSRLNAEGHS